MVRTQQEMICNNLSDCHDLVLIVEDQNAGRFICKICKQQLVLRKDWRGVYENRAYSKAFKRDVLQGKDNLLYKYHPEFMHS